MGRGDNRLTRKVRQRNAQRKKKECLRKKIEAAAAATSPGKTGGRKS